MTHRLHLALFAVGIFLLHAAPPAPAAEIARLSEKNWDQFAPQGKEVDAIYGDFVLRNDKLIIVIANPVYGRHANLTVKEVGGCIIDMTRRDGGTDGQGNDQLSAFYPNAVRTPYRSLAGLGVEDAQAADVDRLIAGKGDVTSLKAKSISLSVRSDPTMELEEIAKINARRAEKDKIKLPAPKPVVTTTYTLKDGDDALQIETTYDNRTDKEMTIDLLDSMRADKTFDHGNDDALKLVWVYDRWFGQAYGVIGGQTKVAPGAAPAGRAPSTIHYEHSGKRTVSLAAGEKFTLSRRLTAAANALDVKSVAAAIAGAKEIPVHLTVKDDAGAVADADVLVFPIGEANPPGGAPKLYARGRTNPAGLLNCSLPKGSYELQLFSPGRTSKTTTLIVDSADGVFHNIKMDEPGYVLARITDDKGGPIPCKVQFIGIKPTLDPFFFVDSGDHEIHNCHYSHTGSFKQRIGPGEYKVIISYGPEYDAIFTTITVERGKETKLEGKLIRSVDTKGWISSDFHSHATPSGDNTTSQLGRVLNLLAEHIEFAPCTEHQRIDSYVPHLKKLGALHLMATCTGMELTGLPLPINHHNAFPLIHKPRTQDGGGPVVDEDPRIQIERVAYWDNKSEKVLQQNHPDIIKMFFDKNADKKGDGGFGMGPFMTVIEVHPPQEIFQPARIKSGERTYDNTIVNWMQLLNQGVRVPGVVNTDAHYNFHGSGWLRNWIKSPTDDPAKVQTLDVVRETNKGHIIMSTGPFMEVAAGDADSKLPAIRMVLPGDDLPASKGRVRLGVRVQCPNWMDVDRVQVFVNGRADEKLNYTRKANADKFSDKAVKFNQVVFVELKEDAHLIVAAIGPALGPVMGPSAGKTPAVAVSNPIFVDVDGGGFKANGDELDSPLPK